jgi:hypothetical protein
LTFDFGAFPPITLLQLASADLGTARDLINLIVGESAPLLFDLALQLFEVTGSDRDSYVPPTMRENCYRYECVFSKAFVPSKTLLGRCGSMC